MYCSCVVRGVVDGVGGVAVSVLVSFVDRWCKLDSGWPSQVRRQHPGSQSCPTGPGLPSLGTRTVLSSTVVL